MKPFSSLWSSDEKRIYRIFSILRISSSRPSCTSTKSASETAKPRAGMSFSSKIFLNSHGDSSSLCKESRRHSKHGVTPREDDLPFCHTAPVQRKHEAPGELDNILQLSVRLRGSVEYNLGRTASWKRKMYLSWPPPLAVRRVHHVCQTWRIYMYPQVVAK